MVGESGVRVVEVREGLGVRDSGGGIDCIGRVTICPVFQDTLFLKALCPGLGIKKFDREIPDIFQRLKGILGQNSRRPLPPN